MHDPVCDMHAQSGFEASGGTGAVAGGVLDRIQSNRERVKNARGGVLSNFGVGET